MIRVIGYIKVALAVTNDRERSVQDEVGACNIRALSLNGAGRCRDAVHRRPIGGDNAAEGQNSHKNSMLDTPAHK